MSIFVRPDSPPPRQPSPDITPAPLPYPHHPRRVASQPKIRVVSPSRPPGLQSPIRTIQPVRSYDHMSKTHNDDSGFLTPRTRTSPKSRIQQPSRAPELTPPHMSTLTVHVCPVANSSPAASSSKRTLRSHPNSFESLYLPQIDEMGASAIPHCKAPSTSVLPPLDKHKSLGMACLRFFRIRTSSRHVTAVFNKH
jgi:hypothetical protein